MVDGKRHGLKGNGSNESLKLKELFEDICAEGKTIYLSNGEYHIYQTTLNIYSLIIPSVEGQSSTNTKLVIHGRLNFDIKNNFKCKNITIETDYQKSNADTQSPGAIFSNKTDFLENVLFENVSLNNKGTIRDGSSRGMGLFSGYVDGLKIDNVDINGAREGISVLNGITVNQTTHYSKNINMTHLYFKNVQTGVYVGSSSSFNRDTFVRDIIIHNISLINTELQKQNYSRYDGADLLMFEKVVDVFITKLYSERPIERATYFNVCYNIYMDGVELISSAGLKFSGINNTDIGEHLADGFTVTNVNIKDKDNLGVYTAYYGFYLYECKNVKIDNVIVDGLGVNTKIDGIFLTERYLENISITNVNAKYVKAGLFRFNDDSFLTSKTGIKNIKFKNIELEDAIILTTSYPLINLVVSSKYTPPNGTYLFRDIHIENVLSKSTIDMTITPLTLRTAEYTSRGNGNSPVRSLIQINHVDGLKTKNNIINGFSSTTTPIHVELNAKNIVLDENFMWIDTAKTGAQTYGANYSFPSRIRKVHRDLTKGNSFEEVYEIATVEGDQDGIVRNIMAATNFRYTGTVVLGTLETLDIIPHWYNSSFAIGKIYTSNGEWAEFTIAGYTTTKITSSNNFTTSEETGKSTICSIGANGGYKISLHNGTTMKLIYRIEIKGFKQS